MTTTDPVTGGPNAKLIVTMQAVPAVRRQAGRVTVFPLCRDQEVDDLAEMLSFLSAPAGEAAVRSTVLLTKLLDDHSWQVIGSGVLIAPNIVATAGHVLDVFQPEQERIRLPNAFVHFVPIMGDGSLRSPEQLAPADFDAVSLFGAHCIRSQTTDVAALRVPNVSARAAPIPRNAFARPAVGRKAVLLATPNPRKLVPNTHRHFRICVEHGPPRIDAVNLRIASGLVRGAVHPQSGKFPHDANSYAGTSGGPLFDLASGELIGLNIEGSSGGSTNTALTIESVTSADRELR